MPYGSVVSHVTGRKVALSSNSTFVYATRLVIGIKEATRDCWSLSEYVSPPTLFRGRLYERLTDCWLSRQFRVRVWRATDIARAVRSSLCSLRRIIASRESSRELLGGALCSDFQGNN